MSKTVFSITVLSAIGVVGWAAPGGEEQGDAHPKTGARPAAVASAAKPEVVLLTDGRIVHGVVTEEDDMLVVTQPIGTMKFTRRKVEKVFPTLRDVYTYKVEQFPENDLDERINLARWCLSQKMEQEAREQLNAVLKLSPEHGQAMAMIVSLDQANARLAMRERDPDVRQTAAEQVGRAPADRPAVLDASIVSGAVRGMGVPDYPMIFDLPRAVAVKRFDEFGRYVHPVLQKACARCHNERYEGSFQLVSFKNKSDRTSAALRTNLDATLKLVDQDAPARSELLSSALRPHGRGPNPRPIFQGSNDDGYKVLATWISRLQGSKAESIAATAVRPPGPDSGESFGSRRAHAAGESESIQTDVKPFVTGPIEQKSLPPMRAVEGQRNLVPETSADPDEFPLPLAVGGKGPRRAGGQPGAPIAAGQPSELPPLPITQPAAKDAGTRHGDANVEATAGAEADADPGPAEGDSVSAKKPRKSVKFDPKLLERALQLKNQGRTQPGTP